LSETQPSGRSAATRSFWKAWASFLVPLMALGAIWAYANPLFNSPDEPTQVVRAAAVVRGQLVGTQAPDRQRAYTVVTVPAAYAGSYSIPACYAFHPDIPASCAPSLGHSDKATPVLTYVGHYPPLYSFLVGWPTLLGSSAGWVYLMRLASALVDMALIATAFAAAWRWSSSPLMIPAIAAATTPMAFFLFSSVDPSGLEIAAAIATWTVACVIVLDWPANPPPGLLAALAVSGGTLALSRGPSPLWDVVVGAVLVPVAFRRLPLVAVLRRRAAQAALTALVVCGALALAWVVLAAGLTVNHIHPLPRGMPESRVLALALNQLWPAIPQAAGDFGWLSTPEPTLSLLLLLSALALPLALAVAGADRAGRWSLAIMWTLSLVLPVVLLYAGFHVYGSGTQGRYFLPLWVGLPILSAALVQAEQPKRMSTLVVIPPVSGLVLAFWWNTHRVTVGDAGPYWPGTGAWRPPLGALTMDVLFLLAAAVYAAVALLLTASSGQDRSRLQDPPVPAPPEDETAPLASTPIPN
jgi:hypothetical protein